jgi:hypothetical protein
VEAKQRDANQITDNHAIIEPAHSAHPTIAKPPVSKLSRECATLFFETADFSGNGWLASRQNHLIAFTSCS